MHCFQFERCEKDVLDGLNCTVIFTLPKTFQAEIYNQICFQCLKPPYNEDNLSVVSQRIRDVNNVVDTKKLNLIYYLPRSQFHPPVFRTKVTFSPAILQNAALNAGLNFQTYLI